jgi:hypothetical protein
MKLAHGQGRKLGNEVAALREPANLPQPLTQASREALRGKAVCVCDSIERQPILSGSFGRKLELSCRRQAVLLAAFPVEHFPSDRPPGAPVCDSLFNAGEQCCPFRRIARERRRNRFHPLAVIGPLARTLRTNRSGLFLRRSFHRQRSTCGHGTPFLGS